MRGKRRMPDYGASLTERERVAAVAMAERTKATLTPEQLTDLRRSLVAQGIIPTPFPEDTTR